MKIKLFYHWQQYDWQRLDEGSLYLSTCDMSMHDKYCTLLKVEDVEIPNYIKPSEDAIRTGMIKRLEHQKQTIQAETYKKVSLLDEKIRQLTCLENLEPA